MCGKFKKKARYILKWEIVKKNNVNIRLVTNIDSYVWRKNLL